ncbi:MAG: YjbF family lipoprotein [Pseudomonadota bacterium]
MKRILTLMACTLLAACASDGAGRDPAVDSPQGALVAAIQSRLTSETPQDAREVLNARVVAGSPTALVLVVLEDVDAGLTMIPAAANRGTEQWRDGTGGGILRRDGVLVGTRGLGFDLHNAEVAPLRRALRAGGGRNLRRVNLILDSTDRIVPVTYQCDVVRQGGQVLDFYGTRYATTIYDEVCRGAEDTFTNRYWVQGNGVVRRSVERVSPEVGNMQINLLKP